jgi:hypothetical protein
VRTSAPACTSASATPSSGACAAPAAVSAIATRALRGVVGQAAVAAALSAIALWNGFPLLYSDTGTYLESARVLFPNPDRPIVYGLLVRAASLGREPLLAVLAQALVLGALVIAAFRHGAGMTRPHGAATATAVALAASTGAAVVAGHLLPDVLAPAAILALALLLVTPASAVALAGAWATLAMAVATHASILPIGLLVCAAVLALELLRRAGRRRARLRRVGLAVTALVAGAVGLSAVNWRLGAGYELLPASPVFLVGRMAQTGLLHEVLAARCPAAGWRLCAQQRRIPRSIDQFVWPPDSPLQAAGGFGPEGIAECRAIFRASLSEPRWILRHASDAARAAAEQLVLFDLAWVEGADALSGWARPLLGRSFPERLAAYDRSRQARGTLAVGPLDRAQPWAVGAGAVLVIALWMGLRRRHDLAGARAFAAALLAGVVANAAVCGALSSPNARYQARVAFLVPLAAAVLVAAARRARAAAEEGNR